MSHLNENDLMEQFFKLSKKMRIYYVARTNEDGHNKHLGQGRILSLLKLKPQTTQKELSYLLDMRPQSLGELLSKLEKKGFITREPLENDRRVMSIQLTDTGLEAANENEKQDTKYTIFDILSEEEQTQFSSITQKLIDALDQDLPQNEEEFRHLIKKLRHHKGRGNGLRGFGSGADPRHFGPDQDFRGFGPSHEFREFGPRKGFRGFESDYDPRRFRHGHDFESYGFDHEYKSKSHHHPFDAHDKNEEKNPPQNDKDENS